MDLNPDSFTQFYFFCHCAVPGVNSILTPLWVQNKAEENGLSYSKFFLSLHLFHCWQLFFNFQNVCSYLTKCLVIVWLAVIKGSLLLLTLQFPHSIFYCTLYFSITQTFFVITMNIPYHHNWQMYYSIFLYIHIFKKKDRILLKIQGSPVSYCSEQLRQAGDPVRPWVRTRVG